MSESDSGKDSKDLRWGYYDFATDLKLFQVSNKTMFQKYRHRGLDRRILRILQKLKNFSRVKGNNEVNPWILKTARVEECYFLRKAINLFRKKCIRLYLFNAKQSDVEGKRQCLEEICLKTWKSIYELQNKWIHHTCKVLSCSEHSVDGLEKVCRTICAAPKEKIHASKEDDNLIKCYTNTPTLARKSQRASKCCWEHWRKRDA